LGVSYVIIGHSSQRAVGETDKAINTKIFACLEHDIIPIVCVGEKERDVDGTYLTFLQDQIRATFAGLGKPDFENIIIAYEPIWAIGIEAKKQATPAEFESSLIFIKKVIQDMTGNLPVGKIHIVYGGSVSAPAEARSYVDVGARGVLIGRASLDATVFNSIIKEFS
jgi:triosephosphate isomerase